MYKHSPVRNQRSKGIKIKHVVQVCLLIVVCFWLIFQVKRIYDKNKDFDANNHKITHAVADDELGRKDLQPKLEETTTVKDTQEQEDEQKENKQMEEEDEDKTEEEKDNEDEQERSNMEIDEVDIIDEDKETENEEKDGQSETENIEDEDGSTHETREEHYKADDASSAVITTHDQENQIKNATLDDNSSGNVEYGETENHIIVEEKDSESTSSVENEPPPNTTTTSTAYQFDSNLTKNDAMLKSTGQENSYDQSKSEYLESDNEDPTHLQEKEVRNDLDTLPGIEAEGEDTASSVE